MSRPVEADVVVVVPVYRNAPTLEELARRTLAALAPTGLTHRLLFVVDASPDDAWDLVCRMAGEEPRIQGLLLPTNQGQHRALLTGIAHSRARWIAVMDADLQDPPELLPALVEASAGSGMTAFARREGRYQAAGRMLTSRVFKSLLGLFLRMPADVGTYFVVPGKVADRMRRAPVRHPQVVVMARSFSPGWCGVPFTRRAREVGESAYSSRARWRAALRSLRCAWECRCARRVGEDAWTGADAPAPFRQTTRS
ncbi:glycosyltransferase [Hydrogenophaga pseudoflava]|uniref:glycosyltransferase n=1 Tax=Hydrogenophaga pseudoflava TaxID=47421 RepID=UPI0027E55137|nr:glycosyltransferase [Hydrogenophaga pseudoflava]MDQ7743550.1 glycosyltransferase [Hydrogenophaga pseudoflava]